jgi:hypothetical protein
MKAADEGWRYEPIAVDAIQYFHAPKDKIARSVCVHRQCVPEPNGRGRCETGR